MAYTYNAGDGPSVLVTTEPANTDVIKDSCAQSIRQIKSYIRDTSSPGLAGRLTAIDAAVTSAANAASAAQSTANSKADSTAVASYPAQGVVNNQTVPISGAVTFTKLAFNSAPINPTPAPFSTANNRYVAPAAGTYAVSFSCQCDNSGGTPAAMEVNVGLYKNGTFVGNLLGDLDSTPSPSGSRWSPGFSGLVALAANDYLEVFMAAADGVNSGNLNVSAQFSIHRVSSLS